MLVVYKGDSRGQTVTCDLSAVGRLRGLNPVAFLAF